MNDSDLFSVILDRDEAILKTYRPNSARAWSNMTFWTMLVAVFVIPIIVFGFMFPEDGGFGSAVGSLVFFIVYFVIAYICMALWCNKTVYAVTNKRILIRTGFIGVDFKSLDYSMVGAFTVNVNWIDKAMRKNTGSLSFGSMASPMTNNTTAKFNFLYISNPYEVYREIKAIIDVAKEK